MSNSVASVIDSGGPLLSPSEEVELAKKIEAGRLAAERIAQGVGGPLERRQVRIGQQAKEEFLAANYRLVMKWASIYAKRSVPIDDLFQEGFTGLDHAIDKFDWSLGYKLSTYATTWIRQAMSRYCARERTAVSVPSARVISMNTEASKMDLSGFGFHDSPEDLNKLSEPFVYLACNPVSTAEMPISISTEEDVADSVVSTMLGDDLMEILEARLTKREYYAVTRKWLPHLYPDNDRSTLASIAEDLGVSPEAVRRIIQRAMKKLSDEPILKGYYVGD